MAGTIALTSDVRWPVKGSVFYWTVEALAERIDDAAARQQLREIAEANLGWLGLDDFPPDIRELLLHAIRFDLLPFAERRLPDTPHREAFLELLRELVDLANSVR